MIYLILTLVGVILIVVGLYSMTFGFSTPPSFLLFFVGLISFVIGLMLVILFGSMIDMDALRPAKTEAKPTPSRDRTKMRRRPKTIKESIQTIKEEPKPVRPVRKEKVEPKPVKKEVEKVEPKPVKPVKKEKIEPKPVRKKPVKIEPARAEEKKKPERKLRKFIRKTAKKEETVVPTGKGLSDEPEVSKKIKQEEVERTTDFKEKLDQISKPPKKEETSQKATPVKDKEDEKPIVKPSPKIKDEEEEKPVVKPSPKIKDKEHPKNRLNKLKKDYMDNIDVEDLLDERLESFKGALNQIRSKSKTPNIIWSFDASDVQDTMKDLIVSAEKKVYLMYPWIRNIDVGVLKKFIDTESRVIIQEASLDDDAAVELIKVLLDNKVKIKTMPHIHTVTVVSDDKNGLIISTDPIYESFEVGVIYKDRKSISEVEKLFEEAWTISNDIDLERTT